MSAALENLAQFAGIRLLAAKGIRIMDQGNLHAERGHIIDGAYQVLDGLVDEFLEFS